MSVKFDKTISLGTVISGVMLFITILTIYTRLSERLTAVEVKVQPVWERFVGGQR